MRPIHQNLKKKVNSNIGDGILTILFFTSIGLTIWAIGIYRLTIIDSKYLFAASALGTIIAFSIIIFRHKSAYSLFWIFLISVAIGGGHFYFGLLFLNQAFREVKTITESFQIIETGNLGKGRKKRCFQPFAIIDFYGSRKQLVFYCEYEKTIKTYSKITLSYSKGFFGFDVIKSKELTR